LLPVDVGASGCWWSNSGDSIDSKITHQIRIPAASEVTLEYEIWFEIEKDWDYIYLEASVDGGQTWRIIETPASSPENPIGNSFGPGYSGNSDGWVKESIDLSAYQGEATGIRFQYVTDDAVNASGGCVRDLSISVDGVDQVDSEWVANGFVFTKNLVRQDFQVQLITKGDDPRVRQVNLDADNFGQITVQPPGEREQLILAVGSLADKTRQPASYSIAVAPVN
jgi:immune inhibitor A